ncbi:MAG: hypothetical protein RA160_02845 [Arsenophonus sp.]|nr:MAG: hypothetical protein RA160_02845 [Arsenophonus sp.]
MSLIILVTFLSIVRERRHCFLSISFITSCKKLYNKLNYFFLKVFLHSLLIDTINMVANKNAGLTCILLFM